MLLAIDVGNTETKVGVFDEGADTLRTMWRVTTESRRTADEYGVFLTQLFATQKLSTADVSAIAIASVVPRLDQTLDDVCAHFFNIAPKVLKPDTQTLIPVLTERPSEVGADLIACAIGARAAYGSPLIVISYGTATVLMAISAAGAYLGTAIAPGIAISVDALVGRAAKLPQIALEAPARAIGRDTISSLQSGIVYGFVGQTEALIARLRAEMGADVKVVATGGLAEVVAPHTKQIAYVDPFLSLHGLRIFSTLV